MVATAPAAFGSLTSSTIVAAERDAALIRCSNGSSGRVSCCSTSTATISTRADAASGRALSCPRAKSASVSSISPPFYRPLGVIDGALLRRFGNCIRDFVAADELEGERVCEPDWGRRRAPSSACPTSSLSLAATRTVAGRSVPRRRRHRPYLPPPARAPAKRGTALPEAAEDPEFLEAMRRARISMRSMLSDLESTKTSRPNGPVVRAGASMTNSSLTKRTRASCASGREPMVV